MKSNDWRHKNVARYTPGNTKILYFFNCLLDGMHTTGGRPIMTKGRKTTFEERVEIVQYCIKHSHNYSETAKKFHISYQQARSYTIRYEENGVDGLQDKRGKRKSPEEMTEVEKLRAEVRLLRAEKRRAEIEISFLKKLEEIERRGG